MAGMPQVALGILKDRVVLPVIKGAPKGPAGRRVSATRHEVTGMKRNPAGAETVMFCTGATNRGCEQIRGREDLRTWCHQRGCKNSHAINQAQVGGAV